MDNLNNSDKTRGKEEIESLSDNEAVFTNQLREIIGRYYDSAPEEPKNEPTGDNATAFLKIIAKKLDLDVTNNNDAKSIQAKIVTKINEVRENDDKNTAHQQNLLERANEHDQVIKDMAVARSIHQNQVSQQQNNYEVKATDMAVAQSIDQQDRQQQREQQNRQQQREQQEQQQGGEDDIDTALSMPRNDKETGQQQRERKTLNETSGSNDRIQATGTGTGTTPTKNLQKTLEAKDKARRINASQTQVLNKLQRDLKKNNVSIKVNTDKNRKILFKYYINSFDDLANSNTKTLEHIFSKMSLPPKEKKQLLELIDNYKTKKGGDEKQQNNKGVRGKSNANVSKLLQEIDDYKTKLENIQLKMKEMKSNKGDSVCFDTTTPDIVKDAGKGKGKGKGKVEKGTTVRVCVKTKNNLKQWAKSVAKGKKDKVVTGNTLDVTADTV